MKNLEIARMFYEMAYILEMQNVQWKPQAYRHAAKSIEALSEDIEDVAKRWKLREISGVGEKLAEKIEEYIKTGKIKEYARLKASVPKGIEDFMQIPGMGPKKAKALVEKLKISTLKQLEEAAKKHKIQNIEGFGEKTEEDILKGLEMKKKGSERMLLGYALPIANDIISKLKSLKEVHKISMAGSVRRMKETIGDLDILVTSSNHDKVMDFFTKMKDVKNVLAKGTTKSAVVLKNGLQVDVRVLDDRSFGSALNYFTGSKEHNVKLREFAIKKGYKLSAYGLFNRKTNKQVAGKTEEEVYAKLGLPYIEPELREDRGEIDAAMKRKLPKLIALKDIKGDLHVHTKYTDGDNTIEEMALAAKKRGYEYICISDHSQSQHISHGLNPKMLEKQLAEIKKVQKKISGIKILAGSEVDIKADGTLDLPDSTLKKLDVVIASVHSGFKSPKEVMTKRIVKALQNPYVTILAHPTGRLINEREPYAVDLDAVFDAAKKYNVALEINSFPDRLDLNDSNIINAKKKGCRFAIETDAHSTDQLHLIGLGVATARRGWVEKKDVINTLSLKELEKRLKK